MSKSTPFVSKKRTTRPSGGGPTIDLEQGRIYKGFISSVSVTDGTCTVQVESPTYLVENCRWACGVIFAPLLGYRVRQVPAVGSHVFILYGNPAFVIQVAPADVSDGVSGNSSSLTGMHTRPDSNVYGGGTSAFGPTNSDILEGEFEIANTFGVSMLFLSNLMSMKAGDRAKVETHLLNDMVRIVAERLDIHTGHRTISDFNDGKLSSEEHAFSHSFESDLVAEGEPAADLRDNSVNVTDRRDHADLYTDRYRKYTGWLGNFIHEFVKDPSFTVGKLNSGNASRYVGGDGTILYRSLAEIALEKVVRIAVPVRKKKHDDPEGNNYEDLEDLKVAWDFSNPQHTASQLREYARYLSNFRSMSRFRGAAKDFDVKPEGAYSPPEEDNADPDSEPKEYILRYSAIRLMRDGCVLITDGWGTTYYSGYGNMQLSCTNDMELSAGRNLVVTCKDAFVRTKNNIEITSDEGGIIFNTKKFFKLLVTEGGIWLKSDAPKPEDVGGSIFLDATQGDVVVNGNKGVGIISEQNEVVIESTELFVKSRDFIKVESRDLFMDLTRHLHLIVNSFFGRIASKFQINETFSLTRRSLVIDTEVDVNRGLRALSYIKGPKRGPRKADEVPQVDLHWGHIDTISDDEEGKEIGEIPTSDIAQLDPLKDYRTSIKSSIFSLEEAGKTFTINSYRPHAHFLVQEELGEAWNLTSANLSGPRNDSSVKPWPGEDNEEYVPEDNEDLNKPSSKDTWTQTEPTKKPITRYIKE